MPVTYAPFGIDDVAWLAGVPVTTLHSWLSRRLLTATVSPGMGRPRRFTVADAVKIVAAARLVRLGFTIHRAVTICEPIDTDYLQHCKPLLILDDDSAGRSVTATVDVKYIADLVKGSLLGADGAKGG